RADLFRVDSDARQRRLQVVAAPAEEFVLRLVQLDEAPALLLDLVEQLDVPDRHRDLAGIELEEILVRGVPGASRGHMTDEHADALVREREHGTQRPSLARDRLLLLNLAGVPQDDPGVDHPERGLCAPCRLLDEALEAVPRRRLADGQQDPSELLIASLEIRGQ